jgi:hypothetical protein
LYLIIKTASIISIRGEFSLPASKVFEKRDQTRSIEALLG